MCWAEGIQQCSSAAAAGGGPRAFCLESETSDEDRPDLETPGAPKPDDSFRIGCKPT